MYFIVPAVPDIWLINPLRRRKFFVVGLFIISLLFYSTALGRGGTGGTDGVESITQILF
jgi:hypothetical protein